METFRRSLTLLIALVLSSPGAANAAPDDGRTASALPTPTPVQQSVPSLKDGAGGGSVPWRWTDRRILGLKVAGASLLVGAAGAWAFWSADRLDDSSSSSHTQSERVRVSESVTERRGLGAVCVGVAGLGLVTGAALVLWPESQVTIALSPYGVTLGGRL